MPFRDCRFADEVRTKLLRTCLGGMLHAQRPSTVLQASPPQGARGLPSLDPMEVFCHLLAHGSNPDSPATAGASSTAWLRVLTSMSTINVLFHLEGQQSTEPRRRELIEAMAWQLSSLYDTVQCDIRAVSDFARRLPASREKDLEQSISALQRLAANVSYKERLMRATMESATQNTNLEMAQRSIAESQSTIACRLLPGVL